MMKIIITCLLLVLVTACTQSITNFEECVAAGNPVMESYPRQCRANDQTFVEEINDELIGGDTDENGCLVGAGYSFNQEVGACIREWELDESQRKAARLAVVVQSYYPVTITKVETLRCPGCFDVYLKGKLDSPDSVMKFRDWKIAPSE